MNQPRQRRRARAGALGVSAALATLAAACGGDANPTHELAEGELVQEHGGIVWGASTKDRLGVRMPGAATVRDPRSGEMDPDAVPPAVDPDAESPITWATPDGWTEVAPNSMRLANFQAGDPSVECYVTTLGGDGGGVLANVNRWRNQLAQPPIDAAELARMPNVDVLGEEAVLVELYDGGNGLLGTVSLHGGTAVFVKMVGPAELVRDQRGGFLALCKSLAFRG